MDGNTVYIKCGTTVKVAAFTGGVDGNGGALREQGETRWSPPSRAAWIETELLSGEIIDIDVAAFTGGVDGNENHERIDAMLKRRRLHGRRGLKPPIWNCGCWKGLVAAFTGGVDGNLHHYGCEGNPL